MKKIVLTNTRDLTERTIPVKKKRSRAYKTLFLLAEERGLKMYWSSFKHYKNGSFLYAFELLEGKWNLKRMRLKPDFIMDKSYATSYVTRKQDAAVRYPFMDPIHMQLLLNDKFLSYLAFPKLIQPGTVVHNQKQLVKAVSKIKSDIIVIKPVASSGGRDIQMLSKAKAKQFELESPMLVQAFIDSSKGVPGLYKGVHDFRLLFLSNKLIHAYIRTCVPGTLLCNVSLGADRIVVPLDKIPKKMLNISKVFQKRFQQFDNCFYAIDFIYQDGKKPIVIEANVKPGLTGGDGTSDHHKILYSKLLDHIEKYSK